MRIGVDVGGTHTDAVVVIDGALQAATKQPTSADIASGVLAAVREVLRQSGRPTKAVKLLTLGTTQLTNAVVERRDLQAVAALRIGAQASSVLPIGAQWPPSLAAVALKQQAMVDGGHDYDGSAAVPLDERAVDAVIEQWAQDGVEAVAVTGVFATANASAELAVAERLRQRLPGVRVSCSHRLGRLGLYQRENANLLNASLLRHAGQVVDAFEAAFAELALACPLFLSQNDGTLMASAFARQFPVFTFSSGPTNSMRGAAFLSGLEEAMVVDVGGTTSDVGMLQQGFPRPSGSAVWIGGVLTNFRMPDVLALGIGGGTRIRDGGAVLGPDSVGREITERGRVFGGSELTATDVAVAAGLVELGTQAPGEEAVAAVDQTFAGIRASYELALDKLKTSAASLPLVVVGGGGFLVPDALQGVSELVRPPHAGVANAIGAAFAQVSAEAAVVYARALRSREEALAEAQAQARDRAIAAGAAPDTVAIVEVDEVPMSYMAEPGAVLQVKALGDVDLQRFRSG